MIFFHLLLLEKDNTKKERVDKNITKLDVGDNNSVKYKVEAIWDSVVYVRKLKSSHLPDFYYLIS